MTELGGDRRERLVVNEAINSRREMTRASLEWRYEAVDGFQ